MKYNKLLLLIILSLIMVTTFTGCSLFSTKNKDIVITFDMAGLTDNEKVTISDGEINFPNTEIDGYEFKGWYYDNEFTKEFSGNKGYLTSDTTLYGKWEKLGPFKVTLRAKNDKAKGSDIKQYEYNKEVVLPTDWTLENYEFLGWYDNVSFEGEPIDKIAKGEKGDKTYYARIEPIKYKVNFDVNSCGDMKSIEVSNGSYIPPIAPPKYPEEEGIFNGWYLDKNLTEHIEENNYIMPNHDITLYAKKAPRTSHVLTYYEGDQRLGESYYWNTSEYSTLDIRDKYFHFDIREKQANYYLEGWYYDKEFTRKVIYVYDNVNVYAKWVRKGFMHLLDEFENNSQTNPFIVKSDLDLASLSEYIIFYNKDIAKNPMYIKYDSNRYKSFDELKKTIRKCNTASNVIFDFEGDEFIGEAKIGGKYAEYINPMEYEKTSLKAAKYNVDTTPLKKYHNYIEPILHQSRKDDFNDFAYKTNPNKLEVSTSENLFYAFQNGYCPIVEPNSPAEKMLRKAEDVVRGICNDDMTSTHKIFVIYTWMVNNIDYDYAAVELASKPFEDIGDYSNQSEAWHLEGVFNSHLAVCEGITKAITVMCGIEGIPCVKVSGNITNVEPSKSGHVWNKVYLKDKDQWYNLDATQGLENVINEKACFISYKTFLMLDKDLRNLSVNNQLDLKTSEEDYIIERYHYFPYMDKGVINHSTDIKITDVSQLDSYFSHLLSEIDNTYGEGLNYRKGQSVYFELWTLESGDIKAIVEDAIANSYNERYELNISCSDIYKDFAWITIRLEII